MYVCACMHVCECIYDCICMHAGICNVCLCMYACRGACEYLYLYNIRYVKLKTVFLKYVNNFLFYYY